MPVQVAAFAVGAARAELTVRDEVSSTAVVGTRSRRTWGLPAPARSPSSFRRRQAGCRLRTCPELLQQFRSVRRARHPLTAVSGRAARVRHNRAVRGEAGRWRYGQDLSAAILCLSGAGDPEHVVCRSWEARCRLLLRGAYRTAGSTCVPRSYLGRGLADELAGDVEQLAVLRGREPGLGAACPLGVHVVALHQRAGGLPRQGHVEPSRCRVSSDLGCVAVVGAALPWDRDAFDRPGCLGLGDAGSGGGVS
jgi:hypothetical protein